MMNPEPFGALVEMIADAVAARLKDSQRPALMTVKETAAYLNRSVRTVYAMVKRKELPSVLQGGRVMLKRADVDRAIEIASQ